MHTVAAIARSLGEVMLYALVLGAGVPVVFGLGIRFWAMEPETVAGDPETVAGSGAGGTAVRGRVTVSQLIAYLCFAVVLVVVLLGILYIAKDFISHTVDIQLFGAKPKKK
ncbi:hypothetical protein [Nocardia jejuensis]|uniref:hypothetical protein n=1 Tax=Nocardia jejuensis TaxID=328049 RepID=UPI000833E8E3|nr:hypothetical protein [Nocardia jejuensis]